MDEDIFARFAQFVYTEDYPPPSCNTIEFSPVAGQDDPPVEEPMAPPLAEPEQNSSIGFGFNSTFGTSKKDRKKRRQVIEPVGFRDLVYKVPLSSNFADMCKIRLNERSTKDYFSIFLGHARLYVFAEKWDIKPLKALVLHKLVDDLISLCTRQERRPRRPRQSWEDKAATSRSDDDTPNIDVDINMECSDLDAPIGYRIPLQYRALQCLCCIGDTTLPLSERQHVFGSKHSLQRHFDRRHRFQPGQNCPFPNNECTQLTFKSLVHFKNHAAVVHGIYMSDKC